MEESPVPNRVFFLSFAFSSLDMYKQTKITIRLALLVLLLSFVSMVFGIIGKLYLFAVFVNLPELLCPVIMHQALSRALWGKEIIKVQCLYGSLYVLTFLIVDSILLAYTATNFRYCYGDWTNSCKPHKSSSSNLDLDCSTSSDVESYVACASKVQSVMVLCCYCFHLVSTLASAPYLYYCQVLKSVMPTTFADLGELQVGEEMEIHQSTAKALVIRGNQAEELGGGEVVSGLPAEEEVSQLVSDPLSESRGGLLSQGVARVPARIDLPTL